MQELNDIPDCRKTPAGFSDNSFAVSARRISPPLADELTHFTKLLDVFVCGIA